MTEPTLEKAKIAYALWRKREKRQRETGATINLVLSMVSAGVIAWGLKGESWVLFAALIPLAIIALSALLDHTRTEQIPSWSELLSEFEYESWKLTQPDSTS